MQFSGQLASYRIQLPVNKPSMALQREGFVLAAVVGKETNSVGVSDCFRLLMALCVRPGCTSTQAVTNCAKWHHW